MGLGEEAAEDRLTMATSRDWADAYLAQARADLDAASRLEGACPSAFAMLLQMVFEKMSKAALLRSAQLTVTKAVKSHRAAAMMVNLLLRYRALVPTFGGDVKTLVLPAVIELENAHPQFATSGPKLEYPWEDLTTGNVLWPSRDLDIAKRLSSSASTLGPRVLRFATELSRRFDAVFP